MLSGIYIYIYTIQIQRRFGFATSGLPISLSIEFSSNVPHCSEEISDRKLVSYPSNSTTPNPSYLQREWRADISLVNGSYIYIYICFLVLLLLLLLRSLFTAQRRRSVALSPPRICSLGKCENRIDQCLDETGGGIEEKVGNRCLNYSH